MYHDAVLILVSRVSPGKLRTNAAYFYRELEDTLIHLVIARGRFGRTHCLGKHRWCLDSCPLRWGPEIESYVWDEVWSCAATLVGDEMGRWWTDTGGSRVSSVGRMWNHWCRTTNGTPRYVSQIMPAMRTDGTDTARSVWFVEVDQRKYDGELGWKLK